MNQYCQYSDADLLAFLREDSKEAFTEIYDRYWKKLLAIAYMHSRDKIMAEEIMQDIFISLWNRRNDLFIDNVSAYLATAVRLSVFKQYVRQKRRSELAEQAADPLLASWDEEKIFSRFMQQYINGIVEELPEKCRLVFKLSREEGLTIPEIARRMEIAEKTAEAHLTKALKVLKVNLGRPYIWILILLFFSQR
ncbi:RNA polymerase sigma-70 factor (ECF subfamily) [Chitinophaga terrae (ex Kim and Jung 2007)]|uniref:RNA polymerase sigma-70 factor n=1 Tax=Chitinophaga terrae (ex Kim and Jung 2007) TaxID=408074 RepID=UPI00278A3344|nr:RNA polymerase sigma-70 factor [Chitinophaga terrae (ex Kim and Jung 2007)]MDQ0108995.1 RNA polymerase sigma-70 factor (ECF subfamily) [Chitinophaga terrae (ex Kim and Jung 2007)]